ncbi:MAG: response regulator [Ginsengibacter sp.]
MKVLIVDSSAQIIQRLEFLLAETDGIGKVSGAVTYKEASMHFKQTKPDLVLLDLHLPENDSFKLLSEIKVSKLKTQVIGLSTRNANPSQTEEISEGISFMLDKYYDFEQIPGIIQKIVTPK